MFDLKSANKVGIACAAGIMIASAVAFVKAEPVVVAHGARTTYVVEHVTERRGRFYALGTFAFGMFLAGLSSYRPRE